MTEDQQRTHNRLSAAISLPRTFSVGEQTFTREQALELIWRHTNRHHKGNRSGKRRLFVLGFESSSRSCITPCSARSLIGSSLRAAC
jgi:hypothetical protein